MTRSARDPLYRRHRFPAEVIAHAVWLYFRFPLSPRMVEDMLAARGIIVSHQTVRLWAEKFGRQFANDIRRRSAGRLGDKWHLDEAVVSIRGKKHSYDRCRELRRTLRSHPLRRPRVRLFHGRDGSERQVYSTVAQTLVLGLATQW
jgi:transposase-like protein